MKITKAFAIVRKADREIQFGDVYGDVEGRAMILDREADAKSFCMGALEEVVPVEIHVPDAAGAAAPSYHDVRVHVNGKDYFPSKDYSLGIECQKVCGWRLWRYYLKTAEQSNTRCDSTPPTLIGGEFDGGDFRVYVRDVLVCGKEPS